MEFRGLASLFRVASHCLHHCCARVAQEIRGILTSIEIRTQSAVLEISSIVAHTFLLLSKAVPILCSLLIAKALVNMDVGRVRYLT